MKSLNNVTWTDKEKLTAIQPSCCIKVSIGVSNPSK